MSDELDDARRQLAYWQNVVDYLQKRGCPTPKGGATNNRNGRPTAAQAAEQALREAGRPLPTRDLLAAVQARGARMKDTEGLTKTLLRHDRFVRAERGVWTLAR